MSTNAQDFDFDEYDKPGTERSRRRRGDDDTLQSDLEEDLLEEDWLSGKKNPSEVSDEELNDDLLQSDDEDLSMMGPDVSLGMDTSYDQQDNSQEAAYTDDIVNLGTEGCEDEEEEGYHQEDEEAYAGELRQEDDIEMSEDQIEYSGVHAEDDDGYQDEVLDIQITEPIDGEFQDEDYQTYGDEALNEEEAPQGEDVEEVGREELQDEEDIAEKSRICEPEEGENDTLAEEKKEESDEEEDEGEESGRIRFKSERTEGAVVRLADAGQRRNIPETLELSEKAKKDLMEFEEQERQKRQNRYGGRGRGGARGGRGRGGFSGYGMTDFRGGQRRKMHDQMLPLMGNRNIQPQLRMLPLHQQLQSHQHHPSRPRGPPPPPQFSEHGRPIPQQSLQPLIPPHMAHRSPPLRPQMEQSPRMMNSPPLNFPQHHHQQQPPQPKNIHINPHFRGPVQSSVQVPLMPPAQSQSRPAVVPQRFPALGDFQQHMPGNFGQPQRPPHHMEPLRNQPPQGPQDREPLLMGECPDSTRFPAQHMFDHQGPGPLMNSSNNLHQQQLPGQGHMGFGPPGPPFNQPGQGSIGLFQREPPRPNLPPHQGHQGMLNLNQQGGPPNQPRPFMSPRQPFGQQGNPFPPPQVQFGMQGLMHGPPVSHLPHHDPMSPHPIHQHQQQQHHHRQELSHQQQINLSESRPMTHHGQSPFHQQHGSPRQMTPRPQNPQQRNMSNRQRMNTPISKQMPQRNSNLRELPVAPGNTNMHSSRPAPTLAFPAANIKPVARATPGTRPGLSAQSTSGGGRGRGQVAKTESQPGGAGDRTMVNKESPSTPTSTAPQDPNEDEETRQYRLKIEEQKRLREEILRKKELRRQMQADVRKKELLKRLNAHTPNQGPTPTQTQPVPSNEQQQHPVQQQQPQQTLQQQQKQPLIQAQQQRQIPRRTQQTLNHTLQNPNQGSTLPPGGAPQTPTPYPNVRIGPQTVKGSTQEHHTPSAGPEQQWRQPQQNQQQLQQRRNSSTQDINRPNAPAQHAQVPQKNTQVAQGLVQTQGPKPGAKRTVMQRLKNPGTESQQVPQKVRVVKLSGMSGKGPEATSEPTQQQSSWQASPLNQSIQRKVTMMGQQQLGPGGTPQASRGGRGNAQQSRVVVSSQGRGRGESQMGRGQPVSTRQNQRAAEDSRCTVSIEGLSTSTSEYQLKNLLRSIGPIEMFKMMPQQRKAVATFSNPEHAANFQMSFHRHMIDLSHIDVSLIDG